jgi:ABC transporter substrate-binding protein PnrA-like
LRLRHLAALVAAAAIAVVCGCASSGNSSELHADRHLIGVLGSGFIDPAAPPAPEATIKPKPGSWDSVRPPRDYRVVLLTAGDDPAATTLVRAVKEWANAEHVRLETVATTEAKAVDGIVEAIDRQSDLVVCVGNSLVDALALVTASFLDQQFLVVGAQLPEPTVNVTAAIWRGASSRGGEVPDTAASFDVDAFTPRRAGAAIRAGVASVLSDITGIVIWLD